jgi:ribosomal subunit interface protein
MQINIAGKQINIGASLQEYVNDRLQKSVQKLFDRAISAEVVFSKDASFNRCDIMVNEGTGRHIVIKANASSDDIYSAFDSSLIRIEKQLRRYKDKLKDHSKTKPSEISYNADDIIKGTKYVFSSQSASETKDDNDNPVIIAEKATNIEKLSVNEAVMKMDLQNIPALLFINKNSGRLNVVYYRADGHISWVDPNAK